MGQCLLKFWLFIATLCQALVTARDSDRLVNRQPQIELIYQFPPPLSPEGCTLRPNGQLLIGCSTFNKLFQLDPNLGSDQKPRTVFTFPAGVIDVTGITPLSTDVYAVCVGQVNISNPLSGPTQVWVVDLRAYQAPLYNSSLVRAYPVGGKNSAGLFDDVAVINSDKGLIAAADINEGKLWLIDIPNSRTTVLLDTILLRINGTGQYSTLSAEAVRYRNSKLYFTATTPGTFGSIPVDPNTGRKTGDVEFIYDYGLIALDKFDFGITGNVYFTTSINPNGGIIRRFAGTPDAQYGSEMLLSYLGTNSIIALDKQGNCELIITSILQLTVVRTTIPGPC